MENTLECIEAQESGTRRRGLRVGAGAVALLVAGTLAACGDDSSSETTSAASGSTAAQTTEAPATTTDAGSGSGESNGIEEKSADEILAEATAAAKGATAVHVAGQMDEIELDISLVKGEGATGRISQGDGTAEIIVVDDEIYLKGDEAFYQAIGGEAVVRALGDRWLKIPAGGDGFESFEQITDMEALIGAALRPDGAVEKGEVEDVDGTPAIGLTSGGRRGTLFVATEGEPLPLKIVGEGDRGEVTFDGWNEPVELEAPTDVLDVSELERTSGS